MPQLKELFCEWEDRWWPQPMTATRGRRCRRSGRRQWQQSRPNGQFSVVTPAEAGVQELEAGAGCSWVPAAGTTGKD